MTATPIASRAPNFPARMDIKSKQRDLATESESDRKDKRSDPNRNSNSSMESRRSPLTDCPLHVGLHVVLVPLTLALLAVAAADTGLDRAVSDFFYDPATSEFPAHRSFALELIGHQAGRAFVVIVWIGLLCAAFASHYTRLEPRLRAAQFAALLGMALGPATVSLLKRITGHQCPWSLKSYGGYADYSAHWFVASDEVGRCFPSGHAAGGFSLIAFYFLGAAIGNPVVRYVGLAAALVLGTGFSAVRVAQGAHFVSHNLWSAAIVWFLAATVFSLLPARNG